MHFLHFGQFREPWSKFCIKQFWPLKVIVLESQSRLRLYQHQIVELEALEFCSIVACWTIQGQDHRKAKWKKFILTSWAGVAEWLRVLCWNTVSQSWVWAPTNACGYMVCLYIDQKCSAAMLAAKTPACLEESIAHRSQSMQWGIHLGCWVMVLK